MSDELSELRERAEEAEHNPLVLRVSVTMALIAVVLSGVALLSHRAHTEEIIKQSQASDKWSYMQAKNIRMHTYNLFSDMLKLSPPAGGNAEKIAEKAESYTKQAERYKDEVKEIEKEARALEHERDEEQQRATRFDLGEVMLEAAVVLASLTMLTKKSAFWYLGMAVAIAGMAVAASGFMIHV
jgi:uncharacterized protein (DUF342 family)